MRHSSSSEQQLRPRRPPRRSGRRRRRRRRTGCRPRRCCRPTKSRSRRMRGATSFWTPHPWRPSAARRARRGSARRSPTKKTVAGPPSAAPRRRLWCSGRAPTTRRGRRRAAELLASPARWSRARDRRATPPGGSTARASWRPCYSWNDDQGPPPKAFREAAASPPCSCQSSSSASSSGCADPAGRLEASLSLSEKRRGASPPSNNTNELSPHQRGIHAPQAPRKCRPRRITSSWPEELLPSAVSSSAQSPDQQFSVVVVVVLSESRCAMAASFARSAA
mmetsp:Transcript_15206/g.61122  ORF Transcript_15206/g.61122 Transcript_15206/m.61122 type:complete len:279 (-) Transcript_15206:432-1268(-)